MKTICYLTGAAGWLGSEIARQLLGKGYAVRGLILPGDKSAEALPAEVVQVEGDVRRPEDIARFLEAGEERDRIVIHCAAVISMSMTPVPLVHEVNVGGTRNMLEACVPLKPRRFIYVSSVHALSEQPKGQTIHESKIFEPEKSVGAYAKSKAEATQLVYQAHEQHGLPVIVLHPSGICGPGDSVIGNLSQVLIDFCRNKLPVGVQGGYSFSDVRDVAKATVDAIELGEPGEGYILASHYVSVRDILRMAHESFGGREIKCMLPFWLARLILPFAAIYYKLGRQKAVFSAYALYTLNANGDFSHEKATRVLNYHPRPFEETVRDSIAWLKAQGRL